MMIAILRLGNYEYKKRIKEINFWLVLAFLYFFLNISIRPITVASDVLGVTVPYGVSFMTLTDSYIFTVILISAILLLAPVIMKDNDFGDLSMRFTKIRMAAGKMICMFYISLTLTAYFIIVNLLLTIKKVSFVNDWGRISYTLSGSGFRENIPGLISFPYYVINEYSLAEFAIYSIMIFFLLICLCGIILVIFENIKKGMAGGILLLAIICFTNSSEDGFDVKVKKYNPFSWISLNNLTRGSEPYLLRAENAVITTVVLICIIVGIYYILCRLEAKKNKLGRKEMEEAIVLENVTKRYDNDLVTDDITLHMEKGKVYGIIGKNGIGKTVLLKLMSGSEKPSEGKILINPQSRIGAMIERAGYIPGMTGYGYLKMLADLNKIATKEDVRNSMAKVGLDPDNRQKIKHYSLGMKQRLGIAQAVMENPDIIILDEPFNGIDESGTEMAKKLITDLRADGHTIIITGHSEEDVAGVCDYVYEIVMGKVMMMKDYTNEKIKHEYAKNENEAD